jgi:hypothetical protein
MPDVGKRLQDHPDRERKIDEALKESFPASDPPAFVGAGAPPPGPPVESKKERND